MAEGLEITNGHAARMRFSRFKQHMEGVPPTPRKPRSSGCARPKKPKADKPKREKSEGKDKKDKEEKQQQQQQQQVKVDPALQIKADPEQMEIDHVKAEIQVKPEPIFKQETVDHAELGSLFGDYTFTSSRNQTTPLEQDTNQDPPSMFDVTDPVLLEGVWPAQSPTVKQEPVVKMEPGWYS